MKKTLLNLILIFLSSGLFAAWSDTEITDSSRNHITIQHVSNSAYLPVLDGNTDDQIWQSIDSVPIARPFRGGPDSEPTLYSAWYKAFWTDSAIFVLVQAIDDSFWPDWKSGQASYMSDKVELYFGANGIGRDGYGAETGELHGCYQVTADYDYDPFTGTLRPTSQPNSYTANTHIYNLDGSVTETSEWTVDFRDLKDGTSSHNVLDPSITTKILFDVTLSDLDSLGSQYTRRRQVWSNVGYPAESWNTMDSCGELTFEQTDISIVPDTVAPTASISDASADTVYGEFNITITFSEHVTGFTASDLSITNGTLKAGTFVNYHNMVFTQTITPTAAGDVTIEIDSNVCMDYSLNVNLASTPLTVNYSPDLTPPSVTITSAVTDTVHGNFLITIAFSEVVTGFTASDLSITNGISKPETFLRTNNKVFTDSIVPTANGDVIIALDANKCYDTAANGNLAAAPLTVKFKHIVSAIPIENSPTGSIDIYPNPGNGVLHYALSGLTGTSEFRIYNLVGGLVYQNTFTISKGTIDLSSLKSGAYILQVQNNKNVLVKKLIVK
jgi:hypothetical protein